MLRPHKRLPAAWLLIAAAAAVCSAQTLTPPAAPSPEPPENVAAKVIYLTGQVSVMRDSTPWALNVGDTVDRRRMIVTGPDGYAQFQVDDGSTFEVFPNSKVMFRANASWTELLDLWIGRIKVHIQQWGGKPNHQRIQTPTAVISVRGTTFDVAHEEDDSTLVAVEEGQVAVAHRRIAYDRLRIVNAGEQLRVYRDQPLAKARMDKGAVMERVANGLSDAIYTILTRSRGAGRAPGGTAPGGGAPLPGDTGAPAPPPPPPVPGDTGAPAPPPPPPPGN